MQIKGINTNDFEKYGKLLSANNEIPETKDMFSAYWHDTSGDLFGSKEIVTGYLSIKKQPLTMDVMERHNAYGEIFATVRGRGILPVCVEGEDADFSKTEYFHVKTGDVFLIKKGVWHKPAMPLGENIDFFMVLPKDILKDIEKITLNTPVKIHLPEPL